MEQCSFVIKLREEQGENTVIPKTRQEIMENCRLFGVFYAIYKSMELWVVAGVTFFVGLAIGLGSGWWLRQVVSEAGPAGVLPDETALEAILSVKSQRTAPPVVTAAIASALAGRVPKLASAPEGVVPFLYDSPADGPADDLKKISGIGPKYENRLNQLGVYYYRQIAVWAPGEVIWLDRTLGFPGRIARERWQEQANALLKGLATDFSARYDKGETPSSYER